MDDTWLKMSKMMFEPFRIPFQNERIETFKMESPEEYIRRALIHIAKKREITIKAGEMICTYLELNPENFLRNRPSGEPTIVDICDPVQFMIPTPKTSRVIETMDKNLCMEILRWVIPSSF